MRKWLTKKVLDTLEEMYGQERDKYLEFWKQFGRALKEGVSYDHDNKDRIVQMLLFESSNDPEKLTSLKDYASRMKEGQEEIFYLTGESRKVVENSPHLETFKQNGYEVLYMVEPADELIVQSLREFEGKKLKSVGKGRVKLGGEDDERIKEQEERNARLLEALQKRLETHIKQVRLTNRLTVSPSCLVVEDHDYSPQMERLLQYGKGGGAKQRRVLELNPWHPIIIKLEERFLENNEDPIIEKYAKLLYGHALIAEGSELADPVEFNYLVSELMLKAL
jgi:molecular chaperone HtpG